MTEVLVAGAAEARTRAQRSAADAAARAACAVRPLRELDQLNEAVSVFAQVWARPGADPIVPLEMLRALTHAGNYAAGAYVDGRMVGAILGFFGEHDGQRRLHSHIMGLLSETRSRGMGFALKLDQRRWALEHGITEVSWTFDPLVRANAYFNLTKLGAEAVSYEPDFYGRMHDEINVGDVTDRLVVIWSLTSPRAVAASDGTSERPLDDDLVISDMILLDEDTTGRPTPRRGAGPRLLCRVPADIVDLRRRDPALAREWRHALRDTLGVALDDGYRATGVSRSGWYVLDAADRR